MISLGCSERKPVHPSEDKADAVAAEPVCLVTVGANDMLTVEYVLRVLEFHQIPAKWGGSVGYSVSVPPSRALEAELLLRGQPGLRGYVGWWRTGVRAEGLVARPLVVGLDSTYEAALRTFPEATVIGRVLRARMVVEYKDARGLSDVKSVAWVERQFVLKNLEPTTAISAEVVFLSPPVEGQRLRRERSVPVDLVKGE
jgi:hypothetical protein